MSKRCHGQNVHQRLQGRNRCKKETQLATAIVPRLFFMKASTSKSTPSTMKMTTLSLVSLANLAKFMGFRSPETWSSSQKPSSVVDGGKGQAPLMTQDSGKSKYNSPGKSNSSPKEKRLKVWKRAQWQAKSPLSYGTPSLREAWPPRSKLFDGSCTIELIRTCHPFRELSSIAP